MISHTIHTPDGLPILFTGPPLDAGPKPALFYFTLTAKDSLDTPPYNQPAQSLASSHLRVFSVTLPLHENNPSPEHTVTTWAEQIKQGSPLLTSFLDTLEAALHFLHPHFAGRLAVAGLSRGAFIACHLAARCSYISHILGFAPMTKIESTQATRDPLISALDLHYLTDTLYNRKVRFYIGNQDTRVGTEHAFSFIHSLAQVAHNHRIRSSPIELIITPSIGYQGHGTSPTTFQHGVQWIKEDFLA